MKHWLASLRLISLLIAVGPIAAFAGPEDQLLSRLSKEERGWVERSCPKSLGPSLYLSCVQRELSAIRAGVPDMSGLPSNHQAWIRQSCPLSLGPSLYVSCVNREITALQGKSPRLDSLDADTRVWIEQ